MHYTLISPRIAIQKSDFLGSGVPYWPLELATLAAFLRDRGHDVSVIDLFGASPYTLEERPDHYLQGAPISRWVESAAVSEAERFIVFAMSSMSHGDVITITEALRAVRPEVPRAVLENSQAVTAYALNERANELFAAGAQHLICGEAYWNWEEIETWFGDAGENQAPENVLTPRHLDRRVLRKIEPKPAYPVPAWDLFPLKNYWALPYSHGPKTRRFLPVLTSRGCPYSCDFCVVPETNRIRWRSRSPDEVVGEMLALRDRFAVADFQIEDVNPTINDERWEEICRLLIQAKAGVRFAFVSGTKAETVKLAQVPLLAAAGCRYLSISPESGSRRVLRAMRKPFDHGHGLRLVEACGRHGISTQACFLVGHPAETEADHRLSVDYLTQMVRAGLDEVAVFVVAPLPGSELFRRGNITLASDALLSFSPRGREDWTVVARRRRELIRVFFVEKLKRGLPLWRQGLRSLAGVPRTKMENLPRRAAFVSWLIARHRLRRIFTRAVIRPGS